MICFPSKKRNLTGMRCNLLLIILLLGLNVKAQDSILKRNPDSVLIQWTPVGKGVDLCITAAPKKSILNDSKLTILKIDPNKVHFEMHIATQEDSVPRPVDIWADTFDLNIVFNAGMYDLAKPLTSRGLLQNYDHYNQKAVHPTFNGMFAMNPIDSLAKPCAIYDLTCKPFDEFKSDYNTFAQGLRMLDCNGGRMYWNKRVQSCSMLVAAEDLEGNLYLIFTRSPYTHNDFMGFLLQFPFKLVNAIYIEGGPETSLHVDLPCTGTCVQKVGSYVSNGYAHDRNDYFWPLPNIIGIRVDPLD